MGDMELVALGGDSKDMGLVALGDMELVVVGGDSGGYGAGGTER